MDRGKSESVTKIIRIYGVVQGVGFRPLVFRLAKKHALTGAVRNLGGFVEMVITGRQENIRAFLKSIQKEEIGAGISAVTTESTGFCAFRDFSIIESGEDSGIKTVPPDLPVCKKCEKDLYRKGNRRYRNPFVSCMSCGPRYTIIDALPYDRENTVMKEFPLCSSCEKDYYSPNNRRFYAQTVSCNDCGPLLFCRKDGRDFEGEEALRLGIDCLQKGGVAAVKGIGGFHFVCSAFDGAAAAKIRQIKGREQKPFAVMFESVKEVRKYCKVSGAEEALLRSAARPIVLLDLKEKPEREFPEEIGKGSLSVGAFLPYTPLQKLLISACGSLVMTSANLSGQPIMKDNEEIFSLKTDELDCILYHNRRILRSVDDSVAKNVCGRPQLIRRSRGYVPLPLPLSVGNFNAGIFAAGGDLKAAFCLYQNGSAFLSQYFGDLEDEKTFEAYKSSANDLKKLLGIKPSLFVSDLHPGYYSVDFTESLCHNVLKVQHHHAHIASVMAEHGLTKKVIGIAFDGTGYGTDGSVWGGEFLVCEKEDMKRAGNLKPVLMLGGDSLAKDAKRTADFYLFDAGLENATEHDLKKAALKRGINTVKSSSMGRLFDAVSAILGIASYNDYEGFCAIELEKQAVLAKQQKLKPFKLRFAVTTGDTMAVDPAPLIKKLWRLKDSTDKKSLALGFHYAVRDAVLTVCRYLREQESCNTVALSGGVFQNTLLTEVIVKRLEKDGFEVFYNEKVPPNDGGICLGQAYIGLFSQSARKDRE